MAAPAKFLAPSLQLPQALDVGRWTFHVLTLIEWGLVTVAGLFLFACRRSVASGWGVVMMVLATIAVVLAAETFLVRPVLDARMLEIIAGRSIPQSGMHKVYIGLEALKLALILVAAIISARWTLAMTEAAE